MNRIRLACVAIAILALVAAGCAGPVQEETATFDQAKTQAAEYGTLVLADFYTDW